MKILTVLAFLFVTGAAAFICGKCNDFFFGVNQIYNLTTLTGAIALYWFVWWVLLLPITIFTSVGVNKQTILEKITITLLIIGIIGSVGTMHYWVDARVEFQNTLLNK